MGLLATGDRDAFARLYDRHAPRLLGLAITILRERSEAEDVLQEAFLYIWRKGGSFDPARGSFASWSTIVVRHRCIDRLRHLARRRRLNDDFAEVAAGPDGWMEHPVDPAATAAAGERSSVAARMLKGLPPGQREVLLLAFQRGLSHQQISELKGMPLGSVKSAIRRSLMRLRTLHAEDRDNHSST